MSTISHIALRQLIPDRHRQVRLPVHEFDRSRFAKSHLWLRPFRHGRFQNAGSVPAHQPLEFSLWQLLHAAHRASLLRFPSTPVFQAGVATLFLHHAALFAGTNEFRLNDGTASSYDQTTLSEYAKRFAEGVSFLFMQQRGYAFGERLESLLKRHAPPTGFRTPWGTRRANARSRPSQKVPDFVFETADGTATALAESKGGFLAPGEVAPIPARLREGLTQLRGWSAVIAPTPQKEFTLATFLREESDGHAETSMLTFVDPQNEPRDDESRSYPDDAIRRGNYAAWLRGMGFIATASDLLRRRQRDDAAPYLLPVVTVGRSRLVLVPVSGGEAIPPLGFPHLADDDLLEWMLHDDGGFRPVIGIEAGALELISRTIQQPTQRQFLEPVSFDAVQFNDGPVSGSLLRDGSFFGAVGRERRDIEQLTYEKFIL